MTATVVDAATAAAVAAAATQDAQIAAAIAPWASGNVTVKHLAGAVVAETCVHGAWVADSNTPRGMSLGALISSVVAVSGATITSVAYAVGATTIFTEPITDITLDSPTTLTGRRTNLADQVLGGIVLNALSTLPMADTYLLTFSADDTGTVSVAAAGSIVNTGTGACAWSITPPGGIAVSPSSGTLAAGGTQTLTITPSAAATYSLTLVSAGATITDSPQSIVVAAAPATSLTLSVPSSGTATVSVDVTVTPNGPVAGGGTATLATTVGTLGSTTLTWTAGESGAKTTTLTLAAAGSADVTLTTDTGLTIAGSPATFTASALVPAWLAGKPLNEWFAISGTTGAGSSAVDAYSGFAVRDDTAEVFIGAAGGHTNSSDNRVVSLDLRDDAPAWVLRGSTPETAMDGNASATGDRVVNVSHYLDGRPTSRHNYRHNHWLAHFGRYMTVGCKGEYAGATMGFPNVDGFDPVTNLWDAANAYTSIPVSGNYGEVRDGAGNVWTPNWRRFKTDGTWDAPTTTGTSAASVRTPIVYDSANDTLVCFQWKDGNDAGTAQINCTRLDIATLVRSVITVNASAAKTQFEADAPGWAGADYCPDNGKILFYSGVGATAGRMYWLTPGAGAAWDLEISTFGAGSATLPATNSNGLNGRLRYVPTLKGFLLMPSAASGLYFLRTA